ncbi:uncharacterized protein LOC119689141 isoform X2 [Teleopsis dalmanni]|uniref:uncharacterized protein LOC119689141 isoform X2 n=1 Tax=Teleopsis dalmanni TaxID=139649 RepID=UPI0018CF4418|nr:uncharacterized protein LOC119689141 isoform X2 [Teleopsis dalmanni]
MWMSKVYKLINTPAVQQAITAKNDAVKKFILQKLQTKPLHSSDEYGLKAGNATNKKIDLVEAAKALKREYPEKTCTNDASAVSHASMGSSEKLKCDQDLILALKEHKEHFEKWNRYHLVKAAKALKREYPEKTCSNHTSAVSHAIMGNGEKSKCDPNLISALKEHKEHFEKWNRYHLAEAAKAFKLQYPEKTCSNHTSAVRHASMGNGETSKCDPNLISALKEHKEHFEKWNRYHLAKAAKALKREYPENTCSNHTSAVRHASMGNGETSKCDPNLISVLNEHKEHFEKWNRYHLAEAAKALKHEYPEKTCSNYTSAVRHASMGNGETSKCDPNLISALNEHKEHFEKWNRYHLVKAAKALKREYPEKTCSNHISAVSHASTGNGEESKCDPDLISALNEHKEHFEKYQHQLLMKAAKALKREYPEKACSNHTSTVSHASMGNGEESKYDPNLISALKEHKDHFEKCKAMHQYDVVNLTSVMSAKTLKYYSDLMLDAQKQQGDLEHVDDKLPYPTKNVYIDPKPNRSPSKDRQIHSVKKIRNRRLRKKPASKCVAASIREPDRNMFSSEHGNNSRPVAMSKHRVPMSIYRKYSDDRDNKIEIKDIIWEKYMSEDDDDEDDQSDCIPTRYVSVSGECRIAPIDVDAWEDMEEAYQGTLHTKPYADNPFEYPPPPKNRTGEYKFRGVTVILPKSWLTPGLYRYRYEQRDKDELADDIRIIKFPK